MMTTGELLAEQIQRTRKWTLALIGDLSGDEWTHQVTEGGQHILWLCGHVTTAQESLVFRRCLDRSLLDDAYRSHFAIGNKVKSAAAYDWPSAESVRAKMDEVQAHTEQAVAKMNDALLGEPLMGKDGQPHPMFDTTLGAIGHVSRHEAFHAGQIAMIRRTLGRPFLR